MTALQISAVGLVLPLNLKEAVGSPLQRTERPADVLVPNWSLSRSAAFDLKVIYPLNSNFLLGASMTSGHTAELGEKDKHSKNDIPCTERGWVCVPLVVEVFGGWGK